ncbi:MAG: hypothetical protein M3014_00985 [Chloroflexota bacterium]|nr:hypothetical protein [Chloroflexota bacterium]
MQHSEGLDEQTYNKMLQLDALETLLEDLEETGTVDEEAEEEMFRLGLANRAALVRAINKLHDELDREEWL